MRGRFVGPKNGRWGKAPKPGKRAWYVRRDGSRVWMRSTYEVRLARCLDARRIAWEYEPRRFTLADCTYLPDFYLPAVNEYWEVKGWLDPRSRDKIEQFRRLYPDVTLKVLFEPDIIRLEQETPRR
jgi:hypothetical protein